MYNLNTVEGKKDRIQRLGKLIVKLGGVPGDILSYDEVHQIQEYLRECKRDLNNQIK